MADRIAKDDRRSVERLGDRRRFMREAVNLSGWIAWRDLWMPLACKVLDISEKGARLETLRTVRLPLHFDLMLPSEGLVIAVRQVWREGAMTGVEFTAEPRPYDASATERFPPGHAFQ